MRFLIIDDDMLCINKLEKKIRDEFSYAYVQYYKFLPDIDEIVHEYDVIFLDIVVGSHSGVEFSKLIKKKFPKITIVFISNRNDFIFQTQEINPLCFIRKSDFEYDFQIFKGLLFEKISQTKDIMFELDKTMNKHEMSYISLSIDDIVYVECYFHKLIIHTYQNEYVAKMTMKNFLTLVHDEKCFVQIHRMYAVNMNYIYYVEKNIIHMLDQQSKNELQIGKTYKKNFDKVYREFIL